MITTLKKFKTLNEHYVNLFSKNDMKNYIDEIYEIMLKSYESIGGFLTAKNKEHLLIKIDFFKLITRNGKISAVIGYKLIDGYRKSICGGTDGTEQGKIDFYKILKEDITIVDRKVYMEVSGAMEHLVVNKLGGKYVPNTLVSNILKKEIKPLSDGIHYERDIGGIPVIKALVGNIL